MTQSNISMDPSHTHTPQAVYANGERFEGDWVHGKRHGQGTYTYADGSVYTGQWDNDRIHGTGA